MLSADYVVFLVSLLIPVLTTLCAHNNLVHTHLVLETVIAIIMKCLLYGFRLSVEYIATTG